MIIDDSSYEIQIRIFRVGDVIEKCAEASQYVALNAADDEPIGERRLKLALRRCADKALADWRSGAGRDPEEKP
jgi:hypothetical protein